MLDQPGWWAAFVPPAGRRHEPGRAGAASWRRAGTAPATPTAGRVGSASIAPGRRTPGPEPAVAYSVARESAEHRRWPVLAALPRLASAAPAAPDEPPALQVLRRRFAARPAVLSRVADLPALGPGQPLGPAVRRPLERWLGRDLGRVRAHTSTLPTELGALAFTTGQQIVFAPGQLTRRGAPNWPLLGHELSHLGQTLAFRLAGLPAAPVDEEERTAMAREAAVARLAAEGWPAMPPRDYRRAPVAPGAGRVGAGPTTNRSGGPATEAISAAERGTIARSNESLPTARVHEVDQAAKLAPATAGHDVNALAQHVYALLKRRLRAEWDRQQIYR